MSKNLPRLTLPDSDVIELLGVILPEEFRDPRGVMAMISLSGSESEKPLLEKFCDGDRFKRYVCFNLWFAKASSVRRPELRSGTRLDLLDKTCSISLTGSR